MNKYKKEKIEMMFKLMEYDYISDAQHDYVISFEEQYNERNWLSDRQIKVLESIFKQGSEFSERKNW